MADWTAVEAGLEALLAEDGFELVRMDKVTGRSARLAIFADRADEPGTITVDDCAKISRRVSAWLDIEDPFAGPYRLMVSSPGVDRPLTRLSHCERFVGSQIKVRHRRADGKREAVTGTLSEVAGERLVLAVDDERWEIDWPAVIEAQVVYQWDD